MKRMKERSRNALLVSDHVMNMYRNTQDLMAASRGHGNVQAIWHVGICNRKYLPT